MDESTDYKPADGQRVLVMIEAETEMMRTDREADRELLTDIKHRLESLTFDAGYGVRVELEFISELIDHHLGIGVNNG